MPLQVKIDLETGLAVEVKDHLNEEDIQNPAWQNRWDWKSFEQVEKIAKQLSEATRKVYLAVDRTSSVSPRYDIMEAPAIGNPVSYGFNGDYYPDGEITRITKTWRIHTSGGHEYRRYKNTSTWKRVGGTWSLVDGHHDERNPHF